MYRTVLFSETTNQIGNRCDPIQGNFNNLFNELESSKGLRLACLNINSLLKNIDQLRLIMQNMPVDILAINETKLNHLVPDSEIAIAGYYHIRHDRSRSGGGVLLYVRDSIPFSERNDLVTDSLEMICIEISKPHNKSFLVSTWYRAPNSQSALFDEYEAFLRNSDIENREVIIMGDLNCDILKSPCESHTRKLQFLSSLYQFDQLIDEPTRITGTSATLIDLILTNKKENISKSGVIHLGLSDHSMIFAIRKHCIPKSREKVKHIRNFKNFNTNDFLTDLSQMPWENIAQYDNSNVCWQVWKSLYLQVLDRHAPLRRMRTRGNSLPWISSDIKGIMRSRDFHKIKAVRYNSQSHWTKYKELRNKVNAELIKAKRIYFCNKIEDCAQSKDIKQSWNLINHLMGKNVKSNTISQLKTDNSVISEDKLKSEAFNDFFVNIGAKLAAEIEDNSLNTNSFARGDSRPTTDSNLFFKFSEINEDEVIYQLRSLKISKSTGLDNIPAKALKVSADIVGPPLTWIFNLSIQKGEYVDEWKKAWVTPIYKSDDRLKCENYRPLSILPIVSKILERCVFNQIYKFLNHNSLLSKHQHGFRPKHSTLTAPTQMCDTLYENMDNGQLSGIVFLDIRKAFDSIDHNILLHKLKDQFGVSDIELKWFESYLNNREQVCIVNNSMSSSKRIVSGVPQGSILGPLLFLLYINDLPDCLQKTSPYLYADDTQICCSSNSLIELTENLNHDLSRIGDWLSRNKLQHHPTKTKIMFIGSKHHINSTTFDHPVMLNNQRIPRVHSFTCLGLDLDENLNWNSHIQAICKRVGAGLGTLRRIKPFVPITTLQTIYRALIQPYFDYCSPIWGVCDQNLKNKLQKFQNRAARIITGASYEIRSADVLQSLAWDNLEIRRRTTKAILMFKVLKDYVEPTLKESLIRRNHMQTNYDLRNSHTDLALPKPKREFLKKSFKYSGAKLWNSLSTDTKLAESLHLFKNHLKLNSNTIYT